jgi:SAM-dependent methyltransferase
MQAPFDGRAWNPGAVARLYEEEAELYDIAFGWDVEEEVDWLLARLGAGCRSVLEPGCGTGRMLEAFARRGIAVTGLDVSEPMVEFARSRLGEGADVVVADMTDFDLGRTFEGAVCPINTLLHLSPDGLARHLECMARHLERGRRYVVQVGLVREQGGEPFAGSHWEAGRDGTTLRVSWVDDEVDPRRGVSRQRSRIEVIEGPRAGEVVEEVHEMTAWTPETWARAIEASPFGRVATYDAGRKGSRPRVGEDATGGLLWHELVA